MKSVVSALAAICLSALAACGSSGATSETAGAPASTVTATVTMTVPIPAPTVTVTEAAPITQAQPTEQVPPDLPESHTLRGSLQVIVNRNPRYPENCRGFPEEGYGDLHVGQQVVVEDGDGSTIALGQLADCEFHPVESPGQARGIRFSFVVRDVPEASFFTVRVGTGTRGAVSYSLQEMQRRGWRVQLAI